MKLTVVLAVLIGILVLACSSAAPAPTEPTPNIDAMVEARVAQERAVDATVEARLREQKASPATVQAQPTNASVPRPTPRPIPTATPASAPIPTSVPIPTFEILSEHPTLDCLSTQFQMFVEVFGLYVVAPSSAPEEYVIHSANVLAEYIDNDKDGLPDDVAVLEHLQRENVLVPVWGVSTREQFEQNRRGTECEDGVTLVASMYYDEDQWAIGGIESAGKWDTNLEEIWHIVSIGWYATYPEFFGDEPSESSKLVNAMDAARGGRFFAIPDRYPESAWYAYYDDTCDYGCQLHEYFYWITMANADALDPMLTSKCADSAHEWNVCNQYELEKVDALAFDLLNNHGFNLPTNIPNGEYRAPSPTNTPVPQPTNTPTPVPNPTSVPTATPTPLPPTKFEGGFVMFLGQDFKIAGEIAFKIGQYSAEQTATVNTGIGELQLLDLYATSTNSEVPYTAQTDSGSVTSPPTVIAGRAYIDGNYAPDGTLITAWIGGEEIIEFRTSVVNNSVAIVPTELVSNLETLIPPPSPLPTPCPQYLDCGQQYYSGKLVDDIDVIWNDGSGTETDVWRFYSTDPAWRIANNIPEDFCNYLTDGGFSPFRDRGKCYAGNWTKAKTSISFDKQANGLESLTLVEGWNFNRLEWPVQN